jgi:hypothetical protein
MRLVKISAAVGVLLVMTFVPVYAGQKGKSGSQRPAATTHKPSPVSHGPSTTLRPSTKTHRPPAKVVSAKVVSAKSVKPVKVPASKHTTTKTGIKPAKANTSSTKAAKSKKAGSTATMATSSTATTSTSTSPTGTTGTINFTSGKVGEKLAKNSALRSKLESRLTALGYTGTAYQAAYGFKNLGQFLAATNVSRNLGISFEQLKIQMTGLSVNADGTVLRASLGPDGKVTMVDPATATTPAPTKSLGQAIQTVKSTVDATAAAQTATTQADADIQSTSTTSVRK